MAFFDWLVRLCPADFRARFEQGMRFGFEHEAAAARRRGRLALVTFWIAAAGELLWLALVLRAQALWSARRAVVDGVRIMQSNFAMDWRDAWRALRATPLVTTVAITSLALGIGATTALFSVYNALALKSLPVADADRLALLEEGSWGNPLWEAVRAEQTTIGAGAFAWSAESFDISTTETTEFVDGIYASGSMFNVLGVRAMLGRTFDERDDEHGAGAEGPVAVISHALWIARYAGAGDVIGRPLRINGIPFTIVGVTPPGFFGPDVGRSADVMIPLGTERNIAAAESKLTHRRSSWLNIMIKLRPGQSLEDGAARARALQPRLRLEVMPDGISADARESFLTDPWTLVSAASGRSPLRSQFVKPLTTVLAVVGVVLIIACANLASLLLARALARRRELSVRLALGASRWQLSRQLFVESLMLAGIGAVLGLLYAQWGSQFLVQQLSTWESQPRLDLALDWRVLGFTASVALATSLLFGVAPVAGLSGVSPHDAVRDEGRAIAGGHGGRLRGGLVVVQVALSLTLVVCAGLLTRTYVALTTRDAGFRRSEVAIISAELESTQVPVEERAAAFERMRLSAASVPGVASAVASYRTPVEDRGWNTPVANADGSPPARGTRVSWVNAVSPGWFDTFGITLVEGRDFDARDRRGTPRVAVVSRAFARRLLNTEHPVGRTFRVAAEGPTPEFEVVGLVEDAVYRSLRAPMSPTMYVPLLQWDDPSTSAAISVRARAGTPVTLSRAVAQAMTREVPAARLSLRSLSDQLEAALIRERLMARLAAFFGLLATGLAALGIYGVTTHAVGRRRREIGIRMALGADPHRVVRLVMRRLVVLLAIGLVLGAAASLWAAGLLSTLLYGVEPRDLGTLLVSGLFLGSAGLLAGWLPARRAARFDPTITLRDA